MAEIDYKNSIPLDTSIHCRSATFEEVCAHLCIEIRKTAKLTRWHSRHTETVKLVVANLVHAFTMDPWMSIGYSRDKSWYSNSSCGTATGLHYGTTIVIVDTLSACGYIEGKNGYYNKQQRGGHSARMRATHKLLQLLDGWGVNIYDIHRKPCGDVIVLKDNEKQVIQFEDTDDVIRMRHNLGIINDMIASSFIGLAVFDETLEEINQILRGKQHEERGTRKVVDFSRIRLKRIFNNCSFQEGGRFYNGWWQEIPSCFRKYIRIDNIAIEEVDFSGLHINLLYLEEGLPPPDDDVYTLKGIPTEARKMLKVALQIILNEHDKRKATITIKHKYPVSSDPVLFSKFSHQKIICAFRKKHKQIEKYFYKSYGVKLQFVDSEIAEEVLLRLAGKGIVALPVHDSFLVQRTHEEDLIQAMNDAVLNKYPHLLKHKKDPSAYEEELVNITAEVMEEDIPRSALEFERSWTPAHQYPAYSARMEAWAARHAS